MNSSMNSTMNGPLWAGSEKGLEALWGLTVSRLLADPGLWQSTVVLDNQRLLSERRDGAVQFLGILAS